MVVPLFIGTVLNTFFPTLLKIGGFTGALTSVMGDEDESATYMPQSIKTGPFLTIIILVGAGLANIPRLSMLSDIAPIAAGALLGNPDEELREFFGSHEPIIVPFMAFTPGRTINLSAMVTAGLPGVVLGVFVLAVTGTCCIIADRLLGGSGVAGAAASSTAGNSAAVPKAITLADATYGAIAAAATIRIAPSVIVTAVLTAILTSFVYKRVQKQREAEQAGTAVPLAAVPSRIVKP